VLDFAGGVAHAKVPDILAESDLLVLPSRTAGNGDVEGIPITLLEAGAVGCPVVATRNGGLLEGVAPELRRLCVREGDPEALAAGLADRLRKRGEWPDLARLARRHVEENFSQEAESRQLVDLYRQVTA
jgi:colanic acid/amylovoran biosynthesis glycosyltransferase